MTGKSQLDTNEAMKKIIEHLGGEAVDKYGWVSIKCISPRHPEQRASARVNYEEGAYKCLACDLRAGNPLQLLQRALELEYASAKRQYEEVVGESPPGVRQAVRGESGGFDLLGRARTYEGGALGVSRWLRR